MKRFALAAVLGIALAACTTDPTQPAPSLGKTKSGTTSPATICYSQRLTVESMLRRVDYLTTGDVRDALRAPLLSAHQALDPAACRPRDAITFLQDFIARVDGFEAEGKLYPSYATYFRSTANNVIAYLTPIAGA